MNVYAGEYGGEEYQAVVDRAGALIIEHKGTRKERKFRAETAKFIVMELERANGPPSCYGDFEIAAINHFILEGAFRRQ